MIHSNDGARTVVSRTRSVEGSGPEGTTEVEVTLTVKFLPHGENELIAHYVTNQITREVLDVVDRQGLYRVAVAETDTERLSRLIR